MIYIVSPDTKVASQLNILVNSSEELATESVFAILGMEGHSVSPEQPPDTNASDTLNNLLVCMVALIIYNLNIN